jgi:formamidopyrimidine-DNA glycosylase
MPELPEVETMVAYLRERAIDGKIVDVRILRNPGGRYLGNIGVAFGLKGQTLHTVGRRGKYMTFHLGEGIMVCHNAMSGYWDIKGDEWCFDYVEGARKSNNKDVRVEIDVICDKELKTVRFHDARLFGSLRYYPVRSIQDIPALKKLGPEAISTVNFDLTADKAMLHWNILDAVCMFNQKVEIKHALMDQEAVAGFGNIYAAEALHMALIDPFRKTSSLSTDEWQRLFESGQLVLQDALRRKLDYSALWCYRQKECKICRGNIQKKDLRGRSTYYCPNCQK